MKKKIKSNSAERIRHGELDILHLIEAPDLTGYKPEALSAGRVIVGHSESGAVHCIERPTAKTRMYRKAGAAIAFLCLEKPEKLEHAGQRHKGTALAAGYHRVVIKRQEDEEGSWAPVQD